MVGFTQPFYAEGREVDEYYGDVTTTIGRGPFNAAVFIDFLFSQRVVFAET
jgi:hypothetical protein